MKRERGYQRFPRFTKRLEATFSSGGLSFRGILSNISENGVFIRTNRGFAPNTLVDIELVMPDNRISYIKGIVRRTIKTPVTMSKNGMGIELTDTDTTYIKFVRSRRRESEADTEAEENTEMPEFQIIVCQSCGIKNKVRSDRLFQNPKCGKCGIALTVSMA